MDKLKFETKSGAERNINKIAELFPEVITEARDKDGNLVKSVNLDTLKNLFGSTVEGRAESYDFTWVGKREAMIEAGTPIRKTLRPVRIDETVPSGADSEGKPYCSSGSVNWDTTQNLYIEGDNLDVLKLLTDSYHGKVKMIYIDPPYNTGKDFVYNDNFTMSQDDYEEGTERVDEDGNVNFKENLATNPRFHSDWCSMIYPRLKVARNLLSDDGVIFISIDDNEQANMKKICDEIFGVDNFVTNFIWEKKKKPSFLHRNVGKLGDYIVCYTKNADCSHPFSIEKTTEGKKYPFNNAGNGIRRLVFPAGSVKFYIPDCIIAPQEMSEGNIITRLVDTLEIKNGNNKNSFCLDGEWRYSQEKLNEIVQNNEEIIISKIPFRPNHIKAGGEIKKMKNFLTPFHYQMETNEDATEQLIDIFGKYIFDNPKPVKLIYSFIKAISNNSNEIILDFFSGSATTAHAVMQLNAEDGGNRKFIMVQLPEKTTEDSEAYKAGYKNICEIGKERIRRAGKKIMDEVVRKKKEEKVDLFNINDKTSSLIPNPSSLDTGFRVFRLDESNFKDVHFSAGQVAQMSTFDTLAENLKEDRTAEDLLYSCILEWGLPITLTHTEETIEGKKVFVVNGGDLIACFESDLPESVIKAIAARKPLNALFRESCFKDSPAKINNEEIFKLISPSTKVKVL
jgi:adenine-specific DNA-methyltransferase